MAELEAQRAQQRLAELKLNDYQPKYGQDKELFNEMFMNYIDHLHKSNDQQSDVATPISTQLVTHSERPFSQQTSITQDEDRNDQDQDAEPQKQNSQTNALAKKPIGNDDQNMINISGCEFSEFQQYMVAQYGQQQFVDGFQIIKANRNMVYEDNGDLKLAEMLSHLKFEDNDSLLGFINFCTTYLMVQNMHV